MESYAIVLFYNSVDEAWVADIPDLFMCSATGETPEEALKEVLLGKELWLEAARANNKPIPAPKYKIEKVKVAS